jgi:Flp pilus assembly protein TadG
VDSPVIKHIKSLPRRAAKGFEGLRDQLARCARDTRANVMILMAISLVALATATGVGIDFARGLNFKSALQGAADAAAVAGASIYLNYGYATQAKNAATVYFNNATANLPINNGVSKTITVSSSAPWTVTVNANATIKSSFSGFIENLIPVAVTATAHGPTNPNIDFYLLLDTSPSMAIAATQADINTMVANTGPQGGCGFACHQVVPLHDTLNNPAVAGTSCDGTEDNYGLARCLNVTLRIDNLRTATQNLMTTALTTMSSNSATYRVAISKFDVAFNTFRTLTDPATAQTAAGAPGNIDMPVMYSNNHLTVGDNNQDADTNYDAAMNGVNTLMPNPGLGTSAQGDTPQEVLMFVTDGVEDEMVNGSRQESLMSTSYCDTIKNRGIRIAVLYTVYDPLPTNTWYMNHVSSYQSQIGSQLQSCASPGLYFAVNTGGDITAAMTALFTSAVQTAYISQ